jgi:hypothetical protein
VKLTDRERRLAVVMAARKKYGVGGMALEELRGVFTLKRLTGKWTLDTTVTPPFAREKSDIYWTGSSLEEAEKEVGLR